MDASNNPTLMAERREESGKGAARRLRRAGLLPAVCYGRNTESVALAINLEDLEDAIDTPKGLNTVFTVQLDGEDTSFDNVILRDYQVHPVKRDLLHVDLMVVEEGQEIEVRVPIEPVGRSLGEREGGKLRLLYPDIKVACVPSAIPEVIEVDVTELGPGGAILASELDFPEGVEPTYKVDFAIARILMPRQNVIGLEPVGAAAEAEEEAEGAEAAAEEGEGEEEATE
ncbi:50S ribosomal protein L25 [Persicimonas caeni]|uniref:Large ribosomal subunit protein bL25 n=1 Tax=Persicimonas caeni TaxID=2292766 RepID=A0A4Y6PPA1_PERCE|nr:50S ribosomal protein L25 [Persicimonas caeni]QDG50090.1 50S ribosomal protein L25 [Persicimonas caeni]QED31311.1 50S ribosomal protein L25 [Persicimonas caeni]